MITDQTDIGRRDPQTVPLDLIAYCAYRGCQQDIHFGDDCLNVDGDLFCEDRCVTKHFGGRRIQAGIQD